MCTQIFSIMSLNYNALFTVFLCLQFLNISYGQLDTLMDFPEHLQLYGRDIQTNKAVIPINGRVISAGDSVSVVILRNGEPYSQHGIKTDSLDFKLSPQIDAELAEYTVELYVTTSDTTILYQAADRIVAGDVYIISGQSNAEARMFFDESANGDQSDFIRVYATGTQTPSNLLINLRWFIGQGDGHRDTQGNTGQWGLSLAKHLVDSQQVPVCIFNGARGGWDVTKFFKDDAAPENLSTNYGRLLYRLNRTKLREKVKAIFWYQGEKEANNNFTIATYKERFTNLYDDWMVDYPGVERVYISQLRHGCGGTPQQYVIIQEALRQLAEELPNADIMSTKGLEHGGCHFYYDNGYRILGRRYARLVSRDILGKNIPHAESPDIKNAFFSADNEIIIETKSNDNLIWEIGADSLFHLEGSAASVIGGTTIGNYVVLQLDSIGTDATGLTYYDKEQIISPYVINEDGHGLVSFYNFPVINNNMPVAVSDSFSMSENMSLTDTLSLNDYDPDSDGLFWTIDSIGTPANGTLEVNLDGTFTYIPNTDFFGVDSFTYQVCDDYIPVTTYTGQVNSGEDDVEEMIMDSLIYTNNDSLNMDSLNMIGDTNTICAVGIRITNITIPQNAIITDAYLEFVADKSNAQPTSLTISAEATGDAGPISIDTIALTSKAKTTAVDWSDVDAWIAGNTYFSTDISPVIQELVDRGDWQSGNAMTFIIEGTGIRTPKSYEGDTILAPKLNVMYKDLDNPLSIQECDEAIVNVTVEPICTRLNISALLEGPLDTLTGEMTTKLSTDRGLLPGQTPANDLVTPTPAGQPYNIPPWNYTGTEGIDWTDANYTGDETDWVLVSFRTDIQKDTEVARTAGVLMKDGSIVFPNRCALPTNAGDSLNIVLEHRNHVGVMTPQPIGVINGTLTYDFRLSDSYRDVTSFGQKQISTGEWCLFTGDADQSDFPSFDITGTDKTVWSQDNGAFDYYLLSDFNLDGDINGQDKTLWSENNGVSSRVPK